MTIRTPSWLQAGSYPAENDRLLLQALLGGSANVAASVGVVGAADFAITASPTPDMFVHAAAGAAFISGTETTTQGVYGFVSDAAFTVGPLAASDGTNDRISLIVAQILDAGYSGASNVGQIVEVAGVPASSPVAPAVPKNAIVLAQVRVPKLATTITSANITDQRKQCALVQNFHPYGLAYDSTGQALTNGAAGRISLGGSAALGYGMTLSGGNLVVPTAGLFFVTANIGIQATTNTVGDFVAYIGHNAAVITGSDDNSTTAPVSSYMRRQTSALVVCAANDTLSMYGRADSTTTQHCLSGAGSTFLHAVRIGTL